MTWDALECFAQEFQLLNLSGGWATRMLVFACCGGWHGSFGPVKGPFAAWTRPVCSLDTVKTVQYLRGHSMGCPKQGVSQETFSVWKVEANSIEHAAGAHSVRVRRSSQELLSPPGTWCNLSSDKGGMTWDAQECFAQEFQLLNLSGGWATRMLVFAWCGWWQGSFGPVKGPFAAWTR